MPPRLLDAPAGDYGADDLSPGVDYGYVDTLAELGGLWSFDSGTMQAISNQYAAMPSQHLGWSLWCVLVLWPMLRARWARALLVAYPAVTAFATWTTGNHFWLDSAGGALVLLLGWLAAIRATALWNRMRLRWAAQKIA
jgi:membrane-associated phospholipid phosphatase